MSLFPAYVEVVGFKEDQLSNTEKRLSSHDITEAMEVQLLSSDVEDDAVAHDRCCKPLLQSTLSSDDFYLDCKVDYGNLHVSTLYYPGRPQYNYTNSLTIGSKQSKKDEKKRWKRYFSKEITDESDSLTERLIAYRKLLTETPDDLQLWESYIDFREVCESVEGALEAAREAAGRLPDSVRLRERLLDLMQTALPRRRYVEELRESLRKERRPSVRTETWARLVAAAGPEGEATETARAALADCGRRPAAALRLLHAFGLGLRSAGLWERLVLAVELLVAMNLPAPEFPPAPSESAAAERRLLDLEDEAVRSGLPVGVVWTRVERARAAAHWRPAAPRASDADPQRAPLPADVADLLLPVVGDADVAGLAVRLLLLAKVPLLPATEAAARALGERDGTAEALLALSSRGPRPDEPPAAAALEALADPPHYFADDTGYGTWVSALWEACCSACGGARREALVCWRLRWLRALLLAAPPDRRAERAALRRRARGVLKRSAPTSPTAFAEFALLEADAARGEGVEDGAERARAAAAHALRAALADVDAPPEDALYVARVTGEVSGAEAGECATVLAVLRRPPPPTLGFSPPDAASKAAALAACEERCVELERSLSETTEEETTDVTSFLRPSSTEWARARVALASPSRRRELLARLLHAQAHVANTEGDALRYYEETASELVRRGAAAGAEHRLARLYPGNAHLNLGESAAVRRRRPVLSRADALSSPAASASARRTPSVQWRLSALAPPRSPTAALASLLPTFLRASCRDWPPVETARAVRAARRATGGTGGVASGGAAWAARLEAEARAADPKTKRALLTALQLTPHDKWLHVRGARCCGEEAEVLADALLEKQLRLHALPDELRSLDGPPASGAS
ncbi:uncharacterized protein LOC125062143 isoform X1 [Pieris napi]|uniref:uncharacterized protein LOC125062143 isoform X1 n=1 Tax=Pieris napi TaxID=78633 RepID=UPI001FB8B8AA|nr:uncharacterized protein LOC125062143 isoform X1 [Pieris napi]XP_047523705.1 uncharacterized protein LOC125062143 isoform X1 [Pieris napi]XP_047523715.1 uncharacterized protein LOC125062143 isoform X1 [Pieris napi]XP_047523726.1 uncharacterized protein LOC125062143 isoform X1 [Pieris napi]